LSLQESDDNHIEDNSRPSALMSPIDEHASTRLNGDESRIYFEEADKLRRRLKYFFMNPCEKFKAKRICPWKLVLQIVKIILVTTQLILFGISRAAHIDFLETSDIAFKHLYLKDWTPTYETMPYPPSMGTFAIYTIPDIFSSIDYTLQQYNSTEELAIGTYDFTQKNDTMVPVEMCKTQYKTGFIWAYNESFIFDSTQETKCFYMYPVLDMATNVSTFNARIYLDNINETIDFDRLVEIRLNFAVKTIHLKTLTKLNSPDCYQFNISIIYDNSDHNGQIPVHLEAQEIALTCHGQILYHNEEKADSLLLSLFDSLVILVSVGSSVLCVRSLYRASKLHKMVMKWFERTDPEHPLSVSDHMEFVNMWYLLIIINDMLTTSGCIVKLQIENKVSSGYEICGVLLSTGNLLVWFGVLRYLSFFKKYNILLLTIKRAGPNVLRFLVCAGLIYLGFAICGWVVLGPYHIKFRQLGTASECLFSLINGDDIFTTFAAMNLSSSVMWWFSRLYLYGFVSLFIYVILSVFISVIMDTYDTIKNYYEHGYPQSRLRNFADECHDDPERLFSPRRHCAPTCCKWFLSLFTSRRELSVRCEDVADSTEYTAIIS